MLQTRERGLSGISLQGAYTTRKTRRVLSNGTILPPTTTRLEPAVYELPGRQITASEGHPFRSRSGNLTDLGGPFRTEKRFVNDIPIVDFQFPDAFSSALDAYVQDTYHGRIYAAVVSQFPPSGESVDSELTKLGATAIARCKPTNSVGNLFNALTELYRDGLPRVVGSETWQSRTLGLRQAGSEYLNAQFGLKPLIQDITDFSNGVIHANTVLKQYERDAGKVVRRQYYFPLKKTTSTVVHADPANIVGPTNNPRNWKSIGRVVRTRETVQRQWFSGAFTYSLPSGYDSRNKLDRYSLLAERLGLKLTPETIWNAAPWTWAVDWFGNFGDVLSNVSDFADQGLVMRYGYIMETAIVSDTYTLEGAVLSDGRPFSCPPLVLTNMVKTRKQANPFGFGVSWDSLSGFQVSILTALGITRRG